MLWYVDHQMKELLFVCDDGKMVDGGFFLYEMNESNI